MTIWVISDTHFNHANILNFRGVEGDAVRNFDSIDQMNQCMMDNWNDNVKPGDKVYHLGDVLFGPDKEQWMQDNFVKLPGKKRLVVGNHDHIPMLTQFFQKVEMWRMFPEFGLLLTHVPVHPSTLNESHRFGDGVKMINVHGHIHQNPSPDGPYYNACVEVNNYKPINLEDLKRV